MGAFEEWPPSSVQWLPKRPSPAFVLALHSSPLESWLLLVPIGEVSGNIHCWRITLSQRCLDSHAGATTGRRLRCLWLRGCLRVGWRLFLLSI